MTAASAKRGEGRIGLALSGGGFRASLFHLGVIRRLEELGIMEKVSIVSAVSGGSIVAAFYLCEMEKQLRLPRQSGTGLQEPNIRVDLFEKIAEKFLKAVEHNLRTRVLYAPYYHPIRLIKAILFKSFRGGFGADLIQAEYDKWFFFDDTMDQLPVEKPEKLTEEAAREAEKRPKVACVGKGVPFYGPRLLLNATSLLTGQRVSFSRDTSSGINDLKTSDKNVMPLSRVVGASAGVPVVFPPTTILGDLLVDGGIADNQGIEGLLDPENNIEVILVSDASGQMEVKHSLSTSSLSVYGRISEIFQFQIRNKLLDLLMAWGKERPNRRFAFIHLLINLKSRNGSPPRVSSAILPALGRIRTDLDQFSPIECEALMYHGYTLIDAQLRGYCCDFFRDNKDEFPDFEEKLKKRSCAPLFHVDVKTKMLDQLLENDKKLFAPGDKDARKDGKKNGDKHPRLRRLWKRSSAWLAAPLQGSEQKSRDPIRKDLEAGSESLYLVRCLKKHFWPTFLSICTVAAPSLWLVWRFAQPLRDLVDLVKNKLSAILYEVISSSVVGFIDRALYFIGYNGQSLAETIDSVMHLLALFVVIVLLLYVAGFPVYVLLRNVCMERDRHNYKKIAGADFTVEWPPEGNETTPKEPSSTPPAPRENDHQAEAKHEAVQHPEAASH